MMTEQEAGISVDGCHMLITFQEWPQAEGPAEMFYSAVSLTLEAKARFDADEAYRRVVRRQMTNPVEEAIWNRLGVLCQSAGCDKSAVTCLVSEGIERVPVCAEHASMFWHRERTA